MRIDKIHFDSYQLTIEDHVPTKNLEQDFENIISGTGNEGDSPVDVDLKDATWVKDLIKGVDLITGTEVTVDEPIISSQSKIIISKFEKKKNSKQITSTSQTIDKIVVKISDICVTQSDLDRLDGKNLLNDSLIESNEMF